MKSGEHYDTSEPNRCCDGNDIRTQPKSDEQEDCSSEFFFSPFLPRCGKRPPQEKTNFAEESLQTTENADSYLQTKA
jgi:hypothetical protein